MKYHVVPDGSPQHNGRTWSTPTTLRTALNRARSGDEIWVAQGVYRTSDEGDREVTFTIPAGVNLYGGFIGKEETLRQRPVAGRSTLTGHLGKATEARAYTVVIMKTGGVRPSVLDGFRITGGSGRTYSHGAGPQQAGGGLYIYPGMARAGVHTIKNCVFEGNRAHNGGAVYVNGGRHVFMNCEFRTNSADFYGGAVYVYGGGGAATPTFQQCSFLDNASNSGAALTNFGASGEASPLLVSCQFRDNVSRINGAAIFNILKEDGRCEPTLEDCTFLGNESILGDDVVDLGSGKDAAPRLGEAPRRGGTLRPVSAKRR